ncbi:hypothetical protein T10_4047 [Trichinella papuae]|uniref:Uncharacterized protein n=1 Tax=Trichinella papuae TaxID=268474 RepID=A0A0V1MWQ5_9BILA|nr:hypothetical protein T10_4047 [Trichinella papuae]
MYAKSVITIQISVRNAHRYNRVSLSSDISNKDEICVSAMRTAFMFGRATIEFSLKQSALSYAVRGWKHCVLIEKLTEDHQH